MEDNKVIKQMGLSNSDLEPQDQSKPEAPKPLPPMPAHHKGEKNTIVIDEGINKGSSYDSTTDYLTGEDANEDKNAMNNAINMMKALKINPEKYNEEWFNSLEEGDKNFYRQLYKEKKNNAQMSDFLNAPHIKNQIIKKYRQIVNFPHVQAMSDDELWEALDDKKKLFWLRWR